MREEGRAATRVFRSEGAAAEVRARYEECLRSWPVPSERRYVPTREGETFVVVSGPEDAPPVVLLHGTMSNAAAWTREVAAWAAEFRVYAVDVIGDAGLSAPSRPSFASGAHALWLGDVLDGLGVESASLVGVSMGGGIALDFAVRLPGRVDGLVLMTPSGVADRSILWWALPLLALGRWGARKVRERIIGAFPGPSSEEEARLAALTDAIFEGMVPRRESLPSFTDEQLGGLSMPVLVLLGGRDVTMDSRRIAHRFERHVPRAETVLFPDARHYLGDQSPAIARFLRRVYSGDTDG